MKKMPGPAVVTSHKKIILRVVVAATMAFFAGFTGGVTLSSHAIVEVKRPTSYRVAVAQLHEAGSSVCAINGGLWNAEPLTPNSYIFHCRDGAQFGPISTRFKEESEVVTSEHEVK